MGSRTQIRIRFNNGTPDVYLYSHWKSYMMLDILKESLEFAKQQRRLNDPEYLARIVFDKMKGDDINSSTGYGIGTSLHGDLDCWSEINGTEDSISLHKESKLASITYSIDTFLSDFETIKYKFEGENDI